MMMRKLLLLSLFVAGGLFGDTFTFTLSPNKIFALPGDLSDTFSGTITPPSSIPTEFDLNSICITFFSSSCTVQDGSDSALLTLDGTTFESNVPGLWLQGDPAYTGLVFGLNLDPATPTGIYTGTAVLLGGTDQSTFNPLGSAGFQVVVTPEPVAWTLMLLGLAAIAMWSRRRLI